MSQKVSIIIVNFNGSKDTIDCLKSLEKITYKNFEVIVIDNASEKSDFENIEEFLKTSKLNAKKSCLPAGRYQLKANLGFSGGNNVGIKEVMSLGTDYILLLNNDTEVAPDFLDKLIKVAEENKKGGLFAPKIYFYDEPQRIWHAVCDFSWIGGGKPLQYEEIDKNPEEKEIKKTKYVSGCAMLIRKDVIEKVGLLEEDFFMYYEDTDFSLRAKKAGFELLYVPDSHIWHKVSRSAKKMGEPKIHYYHIRNALLISKRNAPFIILIGIYIWSAIHYLKQILKLAIMPSRRESAKMIMRGILDFYKNKFGEYEENRN